METYKENTHKCNKSHKKCDCCIQNFACKKCRGLCIFSKAALKKFPESRSFRKMVKERFYKKEFELLRSLEVAFSEPIEPVCYQVDDDESDDEEEENKAQRNETYELLQKFQQLSQEQQNMIGQVHGTFYSYSKPWKVTPLIKTNRGNKITNMYFHFPNSRNSRDDRYGSRQEKIRTVIHYGSNIDL